jgi:hypothetical protein
MPSSLNSGHVVALKAELAKAKEHEERWLKLGELQGKSDEKSWKAVAATRRDEVEQLEAIIRLAECSQRTEGD